MAQNFKQQYGIAYPFTTNSDDGYYVDVNKNIKSKIRSILMHVIFTPKGQRIRNPQFGTDLIRSIFEPNEDSTWNQISDAVRNAVATYLPMVTITNLEMLRNEENVHEVYVKIEYALKRTDGTVESDSIVTTI